MDCDGIDNMPRVVEYCDLAVHELLFHAVVQNDLVTKHLGSISLKHRETQPLESRQLRRAGERSQHRPTQMGPRRILTY